MSSEDKEEGKRHGSSGYGCFGCRMGSGSREKRNGENDVGQVERRGHRGVVGSQGIGSDARSIEEEQRVSWKERVMEVGFQGSVRDVEEGREVGKKLEAGRPGIGGIEGARDSGD